MNGQAHRVGHRNRGGLYSAPSGDGRGTSRKSAAAMAMDKE